MAETKPSAPRTWSIEAQAMAAKAVLEQLGADSDDHELLADMIEGETDFMDALDRLLMVIADYDAQAAGAKDMASVFDARAKAAEKQSAHFRAIVEMALMQAGLTGNCKRPGGTVWIAQNADTVEIKDEAEIPSQFWTPQKPKLDKAGLKAALKDTPEGIPGAVLKPGTQTLRIRRS